MDKKIRGMIDAIFSDMRMSAENLALRDELIANAMARYEDSIATGKTEEEAFAEVASSLEDVRATLVEMNEQVENEPEAAGVDASAGRSAEDFADVVSKAFDAIGDFGKQVLPQVGKLAKQADDATGNMISEFGKAVGKGAVEVGRVAGETLDKISKNIQEAASRRELTEEELMARAKEIRIQAEIRQEADDQEGARVLRRKAYDMEMKAEELRKTAQKVAESKTVETETDKTDESAEDAPGEFEDIISETVENITNKVEAMEADLETKVEQILKDAEGIHIEETAENESVINRFDPEMINTVSINLDSDDVDISVSETMTVDVEWTSGTGDTTQPVMKVDSGVLKISRKNPDVFKTFFSVFKKEGGRITIRVPASAVLSYDVTTTSGDISVAQVSASAIKTSATSGRISILPGHADSIRINSVSGKVNISAAADDINATIVSGGLEVSGRADKINLSTVSGKISVQGVFDAITTESVSGNATIICEASPCNRIKISSVSGSAKLYLPGDINGFKADATGIGGIVNDFGVNAYGTCELPIRFDSMSGKLTINKG